MVRWLSVGNRPWQQQQVIRKPPQRFLWFAFSAIFLGVWLFSSCQNSCTHALLLPTTWRVVRQRTAADTHAHRRYDDHRIRSRSSPLLLLSWSSLSHERDGHFGGNTRGAQQSSTRSSGIRSARRQHQYERQRSPSFSISRLALADQPDDGTATTTATTTTSAGPLPPVPPLLHNVNPDKSQAITYDGVQQQQQQPPTPPEDSNHNDLDVLWNTLLNRFQGDFDNYHQVLDDRRLGMLPREGGGHEHIHCTLVPLLMEEKMPYCFNNRSSSSNNTYIRRAYRLAAFYFDGRPEAIFRFRYYELIPKMVTITIDNDGDDNHYDRNNTRCQRCVVDTVLYTLHPDMEQWLRCASDNPLEWPFIFQTWCNQNADSGILPVTLLPQCDVQWSWELDPIQHSYAMEREKKHIEDQHKTKRQRERLVAMEHQQQQEQQQQQQPSDESQTEVALPGIHAVMVHGEVVIQSQMIPGNPAILVRDQLSLWIDELWIHDRGVDPNTGAWIYGNQRNVPYQLHRVSNIIPSTTEGWQSNDGDDDDDKDIFVVADHDDDPKTKAKEQRQTNDVNNITAAESDPAIQQQQQRRLERHITEPTLQWTLGPAFRSVEEYQNKLDDMGGPSIRASPPRRK